MKIIILYQMKKRKSKEYKLYIINYLLIIFKNNYLLYLYFYYLLKNKLY